MDAASDDKNAERVSRAHRSLAASNNITSAMIPPQYNSKRRG